MIFPPLVRRGVAGLAITFGSLLLLLALLAWSLQAGLLKEPLLRLLSKDTQRDIRVNGALHLVLLTDEPTITAEHVVIGNPSWVAPGQTADIEEIVVAFAWPTFSRRIGIRRLALRKPVFHLVQDAAGRANWQWNDPAGADRKQAPVVESLSMPEARVVLDDARRHLTFAGTASAHDRASPAGPGALQITGTGMLNGRHMTVDLEGEALAHASHARPYGFSFVAQSSGSTLTGHGSLPHPFDFRAVDLAFDARGEDLRDLYFLTGVTLLNTERYHLSGRFALRGFQSTLSSLNAEFGSSDVQGTVGIDSSTGRPRIGAELTSRRLKLADLGLRAAGREPPSEDPPRLLLPDVALDPASLRRVDGTLRFHARRLDVGPVSLEAVAATGSLERAVLTIPSMTANVLGGTAAGHLRMDATKDVAITRVDLTLADLRVERLAHDPGNPPIEGPASARVSVTGHGFSAHQVAADATGTITATLPGGAIRSSLAELSGLDLRGLGLFLTKSAKEAAIRCGAAVFQAEDGTLTAQTLVLDTDQMLITGDGTVRMNSEALELQLRGSPKRPRFLRIRSPVEIRGTLLHPTVSMRGEHSRLELLNLGTQKSIDCAALRAGVVRDIAE